MKHICSITDKDITGSDKLSKAKPRIAVNAILIDNEGNIALSHMQNWGLYTLIGGGVEVGENLFDALYREVLEEAGCQCKIIHELGEIHENRAEQDFTLERSYYIAKVIGEKGDLHLTPEEIASNTTVVWMPLEKALQIISSANHDNYKKKFIQKRDITVLKEASIWLNLHDISLYDSFVSIESINKGWSCDKKYCVTIANGTKYLLRVTPHDKSATRKDLFNLLQQVEKLNIPMCKPVEFGLCDNGVYALHTWIDGKDASVIIPFLSETEQYVLGLEAGEVLKKIHSIPAPDNQEDWAVRFNRKTTNKIKQYRECGLRFDGDDKVIAYIENNRQLLEDRPQCFQHGDYHIGNMMIENGKLVIVDFDRFDFGDPWEEFNRIVWCAQNSPHFATGMVKGYFNGEPPTLFWQLLAFYIGSNMLSSIYWAIPYGQAEIDTMMKQSQEVLLSFDNMQNPVPTWYLKNFYIQWVDHIPYKLKSPFDFSFLSKYGKVFKVFDQQGSGNISFGLRNGEKKYFVKFAGAPMPNYIANRDSGNIDSESAIAFLKSAVSLYTDLKHPTLIKFISAEEIGGGFAVVFEWEDAIGIEPKGSPNSNRFMRLPTENKIRAFEDIMEFHSFVASKGYVALDFYNGSILYDYETNKVIICDIDLYQKSPFINIDKLGIVGSARYVSPEECVQDAVMDEITNVYTMGATAFALFANGDRSAEGWSLSQELYHVVKKAVSDDRSQRHQSIEQLISEWEAAQQ